MSRPPALPGGMPPPTTATTPNGSRLDLTALSAEVVAAYDAEFPDERERYGTAGMQWCLHDNQHLLNWAVLSLGEEVDFERQLAWLAGILEARSLPLAHLARDLDFLAATAAQRHPDEPELHERLLAGAAFVRSRDTFVGA